MEPYLYQVSPERGPRVVAIGGGTGLSTLLRGLKMYTRNITAIVTVADDGGGSGILRQDLGMLPPGDIRNCLVALANAEPLMSQLMQYRFSDGTLAGQSFGNLFLAALNGILPSFDAAVESLSQVLAITGRVLPVTNEDIALEAEFENGARVIGETQIAQCKQEQNCRIRRIHLLPNAPKALPAALEAIRDAEMIVLAPGSLYTSIIPNLLVEGIAEEICASSALKVYACNIMTQEGETEGYTVSDHVKALLDHADSRLLDVCLVNSAPISWNIVRRYAEKGAEILLCDQDACERMGVEVINRPLATVENGLVRHNPGHLARELIELHLQRNIRVVERSPRSITKNRVER
ncbi:MAG: YvcK family protein [Clostridiales bacterium]|nr:YvcK family protein [Candidatus Cacconaster stercorequi]